MHERDILLAALEKHSPDERAAYLADVCGDDVQLKSRVEALLRSAEVQDSFLEHPFIGDGPTEALTGLTDRSNRDPSQDDTIVLDFLEPSDEPDSLGRLGQYDVREVVGRGGMGIVLKAHDTKLSRVVAVKVLAPELAANATARKRFLREARAAAAVSHDHVVTIYAVEENEPPKGPPPGTRGGPPYLVMELIDGESLEQKIDRAGHLEPKEILRIGRQIAAGLAAAHEQGLIHRDIKPSNILLQNSVERVQITDFGLARAADDVGITRTGEIAGTPQYMSPEQAQGKSVDARSDLFSLGSVLYAMCTGRSPFRAETTMASLKRVCEDTPRPIREINPDVPEWLSAITDRLLEKDPDDRFQSAEEVCDLLGECLAHVQDPAVNPLPASLPAKDATTRKRSSPRAVQAPRGRRWAAAAAVLIAVVALVTLSEATGVTNMAATVIRIATGEGTLVIEVDDPSVQVSLDGEELSITGAGIQELKLRPGEYQFQAIKDGQRVKTELVSISRGDRQVVRVTREPAMPAPRDPSQSQIIEIAHELAEQGKWLESIAAFRKGFRLPVEAHDRQYYPPVLYFLYLKTGNLQEFEKVLSKHWPEFVEKEEWTSFKVSFSSQFLILSQLGTQPLEPPPELIERLSRFNNDLTIGSPPTTKEKGRWHDDISSLALGMYQYRRGDLKEALQLLPWHDEWYPHHDVVSLLFQSMAHARLGESDQAKACYESAVRIQTYDVPPRGAVHFRVYKGWPLWYIWARYDFVRSQADEVLASCGVLARDSIESTLPVPGGAFVVLAGDGAEVAKFDTLAEAVLGSTAGDTIEIRGNGPFITDPMQISHPLRIQAAAGFHPVIKANPEKALSFERPLLAAGSPLVLVGLDLRATTGGVDDDWGDLVVSTAPLQVANCSLLVQQKVGHCIWSSSSALLRNCELIGPAPYAYAAKSNEQFAIDNSLLIGMNQTHEFDGTDISLRLSGNTMLRAPGRHAVLGFFFQSLADGPPESPPDKPIRVVASGNIVDSAHNAFKVWWDTPDVQRHLSGAEAKALLPRLIDWRETGNLYRAGNFLAMQWAGNEEDICGQDLEEWNRFWGLTDTGSTQGLIRYEGGDLRAKALSNPEQLTPDDFRLRPDSAGYRAGPDGKDLGADVDLVGPGEAYERWKKTPEYEAWQKETRELMKAAVADQPDGEAVSEADTAEQSEAAGSEADQRPVEKPAEEQTATSGS